MGRYVQMRTNLSQDPKVRAVAAACKVSKLTAIGALQVLWSMEVEHGSSGRIDGMTPSMLDEDTFAGFAAALMDRDWLMVDDDGLVLPRIRENQPDVNEKQQQQRERTQRHREKSKGCNAPVTVTSALRNGDVTVTNALRNADVTRLEKEKEKEKDNTTTNVFSTPEQNGPAAANVGGGGNPQTGEGKGIKALHAAGITGPNAERLSREHSAEHIAANIAAAKRDAANAGPGLIVEYIRENRASFDAKAAQAAREASEARARDKAARAARNASEAQAGRSEAAELRQRVTAQLADVGEMEAGAMLAEMLPRLTQIERTAIHRLNLPTAREQLASSVLYRHTAALLNPQPQGTP